MPSRVIRESLTRSQRWLDLKDNQDRLAFILCVLNADDLGNFEADPGDLVRLWRDIGATSLEFAAKIARELTDHDLIRLYVVGAHRYGHIPRFRQRLRYMKRAHPRPPESTECNEIKEQFAKKSDHSRTIDGLQSDYRRPEVDVEVDVEVDIDKKQVVPSPKVGVELALTPVIENLKPKPEKPHMSKDEQAAYCNTRKPKP